VPRGGCGTDCGGPGAAVAAMAVALRRPLPAPLLLRRLKQADHGPVGILCDRDDLSVADVGGVLHFLGAGIDERLKTRGRVVDRPVCERAGGSALVALRVQTDFELAQPEADVVFLFDVGIGSKQGAIELRRVLSDC
jgi:hypothetical protein